MAGRGHATRSRARAAAALQPRRRHQSARHSLNCAPPERTPQLGHVAAFAATGAPRRSIELPRNSLAPRAAPPARAGARAAHAAAARPGGGAGGASAARALRFAADTSRCAASWPLLDRVERVGPSLHRLPADELLAIQATLRGGVPAPGGEGFLLPPIAAPATPSATEAAAAPPPPPGLTAAFRSTRRCRATSASGHRATTARSASATSRPASACARCRAPTRSTRPACASGSDGRRCARCARRTRAGRARLDDGARLYGFS